MTKEQEEAKRKAEVMLAFAEGKEIEIGRPGEPCWMEITEPSWSWESCEYRIKPSEPRRCEASYAKGKQDPWGFAYRVGNRENQGNETVQLIELTPEVIEALRVAGITYEGSEPSQEQ